MITIRELEPVLERALRGGGDFAEVYVERRRTQALVYEADRLERAVTGSERGAGIRVVQGDSSAYAFTNDLSEEGLMAAAEVVAAATRAGQSGRVELPLAAREASFVPEVRQLPDEVALADKAAVVERANRAARAADSRVRQVTVNYRELDQEVTIANSLGFQAEDRRVRTVLAVNAVAAQDGVIQTGYDSVGGHAGPEMVEGEVPERLAEKAARRAVRMLSARPAPSGRMPVVMAAEAGGTMVHEACGHGLEADLVQKGLSVYASRQGEQVASDLVTVIDDATLAGRYGSARFDDEGVPCRRNVLIERGVLRQYMHSLITSRRAEVEPNGCGRRESYRHVPIPRMSNTFVAPGKDDPGRIVAETERGLYVTRMGGGQVNTANGDFVFEVAEGFLIERGEVGPAVRGATLTGNGPRALRIVDRVGSDQGFTIGTCGKDGQGVAVTDAQPTLRIPELIVGGTAHEPEGAENL
ncbi:MAG: TldD/PmbA family protein [Betaproteobacteria bacterium]